MNLSSASAIAAAAQAPANTTGAVERDWLPLSARQRMVWLDLRLQADPVAYQLTMHSRVQGELDLPTLRQSLQLLAARHDALKLRVDTELPRQWLSDETVVPLQVHDLASGDAAAVSETVAAILRGVLPLGEHPLAQLDLLRLPPGTDGRARSEVLWRGNHLVIDYAGLAIMAAQCAAIYNALIDEVPGELPRGSSFVATLKDEQAYETSPTAQADLAHWRQRFEDGVPEPLFERRVATADAAAPRERWTLSGADYTRWVAACQKAGVTEQRALVALLAIALGTRLDRRDLTLGLALHGRDARTRDVIGMMAGVMLTRCQWQADDTLVRAVRNVAESLDTDYRHQRTPVSEITRALGAAGRGLGRLFDVSLSFVQPDEAPAQTRLGHAQLTMATTGAPAIVPLQVLVTHRPQAQAMDFDLTSDTAYLGAADVRSIAQALQRALAQFGQRNTLAVAELEAVSDAERDTLLTRFNPAPAAYPLALTLHELVSAQARATPAALAVVDGAIAGGLQLSYAELDARSDALARRIRHALRHTQRDEAAPEPVVAVALPRSAGTVVALLAILKAQAVYLPLDSAYPLQRLQYMLDDGQAALLIDEPGGTTAELQARRLTDSDSGMDGHSGLDLPAESHPQRAQRLAYVIYTSGSTGQPKPVGVSHRAAVNLACARRDGHDPLGAGDRVLAAISVGFDVSIGQLLLPLLSGAAIVIAPPLKTLQAEDFWALLAAHRVTHINSVPSFFETVSEALATMPEAQRYTGLKRLMLGGEALTGALARKLQQRLPGTTIVNMYGPTEACIDATAYVVPAVGELPAALPIGKPLANYRAYVVDRLGRLCPPGVSGELCLAGEGLARGYLRRPDATADKFMPDAFAAQPGQRLYRTGDLARWTHDGQIEFLGRNDQQVKIRGHRIETGEIEAALLQHTAVAQAAVVARKDANGQGQLVGYLVEREGARLPDFDELKRWLLLHLPDVMVPAVLMTLQALPLTTNGKLDLRALPEPDAAAFAQPAYVAPEGTSETTLAGLWAELLKRERIGRNDHFFNLGGHSLLAITLVDRMRRAGLQVQVRDVFEHPSLHALAAAAHSQAGAAPLPAIALADRSRPLPLSFAQERLWLLAQIDPQASLAYHLPGGVRLRGDLDLAALRGALARIVSRHEALRTTFRVDAGGQAVQHIAPAKDHFDLPLTDLSLRAAPQAELHRVAATEAGAAFDLQHGPLLRARLLKLGMAEHVLLVTLHHIVADGWSMNVLIQELGTYYSACLAAPSAGTAATAAAAAVDLLPPLPVQYADYAAWQRADLQGAKLQQKLDFWQAHLAGAPASIELPTDRPRPALQSYAGDAIAFSLDARLTGELQALAQRNGCTPFMLLLAAWAALLSRLSGQGSVVIGTPTAQRTRAELEPMIGFFVNTLALHVDVETAATVPGLLAQVRQTLLATQDHQDLPFAQLVEALKPPRSAAHGPLFQVMLSWLNTPPQLGALPGLEVSALAAPSQDPQGPQDPQGQPGSQTLAKYELTLDLQPAGDTITGTLTYATALFDRATAERHLGQLRQLLHAMTAAEPADLKRLSILDAAERHQLLHGWNDTAAPYPRDICIHAQFEAQAARTPQALALVAGSTRLSYEDLNRRANRLAQRLIALGVQPDDRVAVALPRGADMVVAVIAALKAGAGYVPLDPDYPAERLRDMLLDSAPVALLTLPRVAGLLGELPASTAVLDLGALALDDSDSDDTDPVVPGLHTRHLAYVIYTSGSTGRPKGVMIDHGPLVMRLVGMQQAFPLLPEDRFLQRTSLSFDVAVQEIFWPLTNGAAIVLVDAERPFDTLHIAQLMAQQQVTVANFVPALLERVLDAPALRDCHALRAVLCGGEALSPELLRKCLGTVRAPFFNIYGPTETVINALMWRSDGEVPATVPPIGRPLPNTRCYILDAHGAPVPVGVAGEMFLGGPGMARGYLHQPELTADRFLPDPYDIQPGARLYKTGDLARWRADGSVDYLGRNDHQVKVRGYRIELGEIESRLLACAGVREAVVLALEDAASGAARVRRLVAYFTAEGEIGATALRQQLGAHLPDYMVPAAFVQLQALPLLPNGKLNRQALPAPDAQAYGARDFVPPQGPTEQRLAAIWAALLKQPQIGRDDNFFDLGGHSLLAISLMESMRQAGLSVDVATLFAQPTLRGLAAACEAGGSTARVEVPPVGIPSGATRITPDMLPMVALNQAQVDAVVASVPGGAAAVQDIYPLAPLQEGMLFHHLKQSRGDVFLTPVIFGFDSREAFTRFTELLQQVIARHDILRTSVAWSGLPEPVQVVWREAQLRLEEARPAGATADALQALKQVVDPQQHRIDLRTAPLMRAVAMPDAAHHRWLLALCLHHLALDHTSMDIVLQEISALRQGQPLPPPLPLRNLLWQARQGVTTAEHEAYFRQTLGDVEAPTAPYGLSQVQGDAQGVREAHAMLPAGLSAQLRQQARDLSVSTASLMHLAWGLVLAATRSNDAPLDGATANSDVVFGTVLFGRMNAGPGADRALGMLINTLPLRLHLGTQGVAAAAQATQEALRALMRHEHASLALAQRCSGVRAPTPLFTALFNYRHAYAADVVSDLKVLWGEERTGYPLALAVDDDGTGFGFAVQALQPADPQRVARLMTRAVEQLVQALRETPQQPCAALDLVDADERQQLLQHFNPPPLAYPHLETLHERVRAQVRATPQALAVVDGELRLSYAELDARSDALAARIRAAVATAGEEPVVGVALPRSADTVVALLAILKAQAVYLPLDTAYPPARLQYMLDDAQAALLIDAPGDELTAGLQSPRLQVRGAAAALPDEIDPQRAQRLAYVIYTSGSTGLPKPVGMSHGAAVNLAYARQGHDPLGVGDRVLAAISVGFDVSIGQLLLPLLSGATIVIAPPLRTLQAQEFWALLQRHAVTHINSVPSFFETVSAALPPEGYRGLKRLMLGGEALTGALARKLQQRLPGTQIVNMYGPTETCIDATAYVVSAEGEIPAALPIGKPLANYRAYVLDPQGRLLPTGVVGELCIAGAGLARGYLSRPESTAAKFVADPYAAEVGAPGDRLYRTGDLARWTADGQIEFLGRNDQQVKIRGHRIETGEIEAALLEQPGISQAAVIARKDAAGQNRLLAYVVALGDEQAPADGLKAALALRLPDYMVPSAIVWLPALPLTANGKLDLRALPDAQAALASQQVYEAPQGAVEPTLAALWCELLKCQRVGRDDDFFALGGQSLVAITLAERLRQAGWHIEVSALFERPTLRAMAAACTPLNESATRPAVPSVGIPAGATQITPEMLPMVALTQVQIDAIVAATPGGAAQVQDIYPLAPLQQGILYHHLLQPVGDVYLTPMIAGFTSRETLQGFLHALQQVMARHDILRTAIAWEGLLEPVQVVWRQAHLTLEELHAAPAGMAALDHLKASVDPRVNRIDLRRAPLLRTVALHDAAGSRWLLALCLHHLSLDHTSMEIVMQEVGLIQQAAARGVTPVLPPAVPFRQMVWQARQGQDESAHQAYFSRVLGDVTAPTAPFGLAEVRGDAEGVGQAHHVLPAALAQAVREQARVQGVSAAALLHMAWALVLSRSSEPGSEAGGDAADGASRDDVVFGTVLFGRMNAGPGADRALGMLINTLPLRLHLGARGVAQALAETHTALLELVRHEHASLALAQRCSSVAAPAPLFTALFNVRHNTPADAPSADAARDGSSLVWTEERTGYPLALAVNDDGSGFSLDVQVQSPVNPQQLARLMEQALAQIVRALQTAPQTPCDALDIVPAADRAWLLAQGAPAAVTDPGHGLLHHRVRAQARLTPDAPAVIDGEQALSYAELDARSDAAARRIRAALAGCTQPEPVVALALPRSLDTVLYLLAILKAGAVYLPLDIAYPTQRLQYLLDDAGAALLIDHGQAATADLRAPRLDAAAGEQATLVDDASASMDRLAYVIYTSGSTGLPKPVGVSHRAAINLALARQVGHDPIGAGSRVLAAISVGFDVSIGQLLLPLLQGAAIVIAPPLKTLQPEAFWALLAQHRVTHINSVPSFFDTVSEALVALPPEQRYSGLQRLMLGGEALSGALARKLQQRLPGTQIVNMYGPTEACIDATAFVVPASGDLPATWPSSLPIGKPLANYRAYVLDALGRLCPPGAVGELCLAGAGLARGYLRRPEATAEKFVADPYGPAGSRLYRSGDMARWTADGQIEFLGRNDQQVKIRGQRVETGEIEATLLQFGGVQQAAVIAAKDASGQARLLAYVVGLDAAALAGLKPWLAQRLPEHMLPTAFVPLDALPLTTNGKLDRRALPQVDTLPAASTPYVAPRDALETALQAAWQQALGREAVGMDDDFFALGGHSLLALKLVSACQTALREAGMTEAATRLELRHLLSRPNIAALAQAARGVAAGAELPASLLALRSGSGGGNNGLPVFCVHPQSGTAWCFADIARALPPGTPVWGLQARGVAAGEEPLDSVPAMATHYLRAMRAVQPQGPYRILGYSSGGVAAFEIAAQLRAAGEAVDWLLLLDSPYPDGQDRRAATDAEVLHDAGQLLGVDHTPTDAAELLALMQARGLADATQSVADMQRLIATARATVQATRRYTAAPLAVRAVQVRALRRERPAPDWTPLLPGGALRTVDLDCDHIELVSRRMAPAVAAEIAALLR